jgi:hypothetical protein
MDDIDELLALARDVDLFAVIERISADPDLEHAAAAFGKLAKRLYSAEKSVSGAVAIGRAGIQFCLCFADAAKRQALRQQAKALAFNLGADTWPGWGEEGIVISASDLDAGLDAARLNLRLALELERGPLAESRAFWLVGAHRLARAEDAAAVTEFSRARERARDAANGLDEQLNAGYIALTGALSGSAQAQHELASILERLRSAPAKDAPFVAEQLEKALAVFRAARRSAAAP